MPGDHVYRPLSGLTRTVVVLLVLGVLVGIVSLYSSTLQLDLLNRHPFSQAEGEANDNRERAIGLLELGIYLVTIICFGIWIVRAQRNVRALGATTLPIQPGWAVGYFFVPVLNLFRPYQAMRDMLKASRNPAKWRSASGSPLLPLWWTLWLVANIVGRISFQVTSHAKSLSDFREATQFHIAAELLSILLDLVVICLVVVISRAQQQASTASNAALEWPAEHWKSEPREDDERIAFPES